MNAAEYERMFSLEERYWWFVSRHRLVQDILRCSVALDATSSILDIGCGTGAMSVLLAPGRRLISADFSPLALRFCRKRGLANLASADAMRLPFRAETFQAVVAMDVLEHLKDDQAALCEMFRILRPGGKLVATVPAGPHLWSEHDAALMHFRRYRKPELQSRLMAAGFRIERLSYTMSALYPVVALQRRLNARRPWGNPPKASLPLLPAPVNATLAAFTTWEGRLARRMPLPIGLTLFCVTVKP